MPSALFPIKILRFSFDIFGNNCIKILLISVSVRIRCLLSEGMFLSGDQKGYFLPNMMCPIPLGHTLSIEKYFDL